IDVASVRSAIVATLGSQQHGWRIISSGELVEYWGSQVRRAFSAVYVLAAVILLVVLFGIMDNVSAGVAERTRQLGLMRAFGVRRRRMWGMVLVEAMVVSILGLTLAVMEGVALGNLWVASTLPYLLGWVIELHIPAGLIVGVLLVTVASCGLAAVAPARRAAR